MTVTVPPISGAVDWDDPEAVVGTLAPTGGTPPYTFVAIAPGRIVAAAATDQPDTAAVTVGAVASASVAATDEPDTAALVVAAIASATLAATDEPDAAAVTVSVAEPAALWLIFGQSNAQGRAPRSQDPAKVNTANAVDYFGTLPLGAAAYPGPHPWWRVSRPAVTASSSINGRLESLSLAGAAPTTTTHVYTAGNFGIPAGTQSFGPEIGLARAVLESDVPASWRNDADPRLYVLKPAVGGVGVDRFRDGGDLNAYVLEHLTQASGTNLGTVAAAKTVLIQGAIFVIGEQDSNLEDAGTVAAGSFQRRMSEWIRQVRDLFGHADLPVVLAEIFDDGGAVAKSAAINTQLGAVAAAAGNATVLDSAAWGVADTVHYDAAAMDDLGAQAFGWFRTRPEAGADGLISSRPYAGLRPVLTLPPVWKDHAPTTSVFYVRASVAGTVHLATLVSTPADGAAVKAAAHVSVAVTANTDAEVNGTGFSSEISTVWAVIESTGGVFSTPVAVERNPNPGKFIIDTPNLLSDAVGGVAGSIRVNTGGTLHWAVYPRAQRTVSTRDVIDRAFLPVAAGADAIVAANTTQPFAVTGLAADDYSLFITSRTAAGAEGETWRVDFEALAATASVTVAAADEPDVAAVTLTVTALSGAAVTLAATDEPDAAAVGVTVAVAATLAAADQPDVVLVSLRGAPVTAVQVRAPLILDGADAPLILDNAVAPLIVELAA